jgi:predicted ATPase
MLKKLTIRNFKAIQDMTIEFTPLTVLIGGNSCGKSTVLQAIDFLRSASNRDIKEYLKEKGWEFYELRTKAEESGKQPIEFISVYELENDKHTFEIEWSIKVNFFDGAFQIEEKFIDLNAGTDLFPPDAPERKIYIESSLLKLIHIPVDERKELLALKKYLMWSNFFGVLSLEKVRIGNNFSDRVYDIGIGGSNLTAFINWFSPEERKRLDDILSDFLGYKFSVGIMDTGTGIVLFIREQHDENGITVHSTIHVSHISDGLLRLIAFVAMSINQPNCEGMFLFDEIEDGINPYLTERIIGLFRNIIKEFSQQIIVTTHSPEMVNDISPEEIVFLWKDGKGAVHNKHLFDINELQEMLEYLNPGDAWMNIRQEELLSKVNKGIVGDKK